MGVGVAGADVFEMLLDDTNAAPPSPNDHPERTRSNSATDAANDTRPDQHVHGGRENRADDADGRDRAGSTDTQQPAPSKLALS